MFSSNSPSLFCTKTTTADAGVTAARKGTRSSAYRQNTSKRHHHVITLRRMMTQKKKVYVAFSSVRRRERLFLNPNDAILTTKTSYSTKKSRLLRKLLLTKAKRYGSSGRTTIKEQLEKRKKKCLDERSGRYACPRNCSGCDE